MATTRESSTDRFFDAIVERQEAIYDTVRANNDRYHRFLRSLIEGARQGSRDWADVGRHVVKRPADIVGLYEAASDAIGNSQARYLALAREWLDDVVESQRESREVFRRGLGDVREAVERVQANAPSFLRNRPWTRRNAKEPEAEPEQEPEPAREG